MQKKNAKSQVFEKQEIKLSKTINPSLAKIIPLKIEPEAQA